MKETPLHIAALNGSAEAVAALLAVNSAMASEVDIRGRTALVLAEKRGIPEVIKALGGDAKTDTPQKPTLLVHHPLCLEHHTCPAPITRSSDDPPPENVVRLQVLADKDLGTLRQTEFDSLTWMKAPRGAISDILRCHEYSYLQKLKTMCASLGEDEVGNLDGAGGDTAVSKRSYEAAMHAAGSVVAAVDKVMDGDVQNAFCAVRPPGHHTGPGGVVAGVRDPVGSHGFCLFNNVATGAAYALHNYRNKGIKKVALVDFDVHHGNGTEAMCDGVLPKTLKKQVKLMDCEVTMETPSYHPWLDEEDPHRVMFASTHGYGQSHEDPRAGHFFPGTGSTRNTRNDEAARTDLKTWNHFKFDALDKSTHGEAGPWIVDVAFSGPCRRRKLWKSAWRDHIIPALIEFSPDMLFISAGFDAHKRDTINQGYIGVEEDDYAWLTRELVKVANTCSQGRVISVLEGGYRVQGLAVSPFGRSVAAHMRQLVHPTKEKWNKEDAEWERQEEERKEQERIQKQKEKQEALQRLHEQQAQARQAAEELATQEALKSAAEAPAEVEPDAKRQKVEGDAA